MEPDKIFDSLKEKIIWLDIAPETILNLSELSDEFGSSRTPVKEALIALQAEGWVMRHGSKFMVTPLSLNRIKEITEIRSILEVQATIWAMLRINQQGVEQLETIIEEANALGDPASIRDVVMLDFKYHRAIYRATGNIQLMNFLDMLLSQYLRFWLAMQTDIDPHNFFTEHVELTEAINSRDESSVRAVSARHIKTSVDAIKRAFLEHI
ncbi:MAG: GntR family transcriptional regulator [Deltaproteobacteria bacterium]|nr:GntR family transcriptional regulator [Deltaproteobacteria bacterium]